MTERISKASRPISRSPTSCAAKIVSGELAPGDHLPSDRENARQSGCTYATAAKVLATLPLEGIAESFPDHATVVSGRQRHRHLGDRYQAAATRSASMTIQAIHNEPIAAELILVDNASNHLFETPPHARRVTLTERRASAQHATPASHTPFVVIADADDEIAPGSLARSLSLLDASPTRQLSSVAVSSKNTATAGAASPHASRSASEDCSRTGHRPVLPSLPRLYITTLGDGRHISPGGLLRL